MRAQVTPEQIQALNDGQEIVVLVRIRHRWPLVAVVFGKPWVVEQFPGDPSTRKTIECPVSVGDTVEVIPTDTLRISNDGGTAFCQHSGFQPVLRPTVLHIAHHEVDGVHNWELRLNQ